MSGWGVRVSAWTGRPAVQDAGLVVLLLTGTVAWQGPPGLTWWWAASGLCLLALAARRRWPVAALVAAVAGSLAHMALVAGPSFADLAAPVVLGTLASRYGQRAAFAFLGAALLVTGGWSLYVALDGRVDGWALDQVPAVGGHTLGEPFTDEEEPGPTDWGTLPLFGALIAGWAVGSGARSRREYLGTLAARARDLERERDQRAALAAAAERDRLTRELHDVVAHGLSVIVMQAQGADAAFDKRPADARAALATIVDTGRASLADMRRVLAAGDSAGPGGSAARHPAPGLDRLPQLVARVRESGTPVELRMDGTEGALPGVVELSAYRIVQEALTNVMKHAGPAAQAEVRVCRHADRLVVEVTDDGVAEGEPDGSGNGLRGMRDRVALLGGELSAAPAPGGGFAVRAQLPLEQGRSE
ncbi:sensor histidine kinase [Streptomyces sp. TRM66268-LWL]|uniref:histidine kinase n=1 Tax=Streptomyces polyasparticus TaxID=2767826 RepID=A0ABR7SSE4_9ACTN|nr:sensor histidine kinase [Streptomyces polyasparticus]MBC9717595.1 sensor histidine kinase [Streptomyces polyasparticus]